MTEENVFLWRRRRRLEQGRVSVKSERCPTARENLSGCTLCKGFSGQGTESGVGGSARALTPTCDDQSPASQLMADFVNSIPNSSLRQSLRFPTKPRCLLPHAKQISVSGGNHDLSLDVSRSTDRRVRWRAYACSWLWAQCPRPRVKQEGAG